MLFISTLNLDPQSDPSYIGQDGTHGKDALKHILQLYISLMKRVLLLYQAGSRTQDLLDTLQDTRDPSDYEKAIGKLDAYFAPKSYLNYEIFKFHTAK